MENENGRLRIKVNAKINLTLEVLGLRPDGYHELRSVMLGVGVADMITMRRIAGCDRAYRVAVRSNELLPYQNTARRAAEAYFGLLEAKGLLSAYNAPGVEIFVEKHIPAEAGLGGGSADAAGVLRGMQRLFPGITDDELYKLSAGIGADVPFCLHGGCALCEGIGERMTDLPFAPLYLLIVKPRRGVSTGALFRALDGGGEPPAENRSAALTEALEKLCSDVRTETNERLGLLASSLVNDLSPAAEALVPEIGDYRRRMLGLGALGAQMTGSGSAVFGVFSCEENARAAYKAFGGCAFRAVCRGAEVPVSIIE